MFYIKQNLNWSRNMEIMSRNSFMHLVKCDCHWAYLHEVHTYSTTFWKNSDTKVCENLTNYNLKKGSWICAHIHICVHASTQTSVSLSWTHLLLKNGRYSSDCVVFTVWTSPSVQLTRWHQKNNFSWCSVMLRPNVTWSCWARTCKVKGSHLNPWFFARVHQSFNSGTKGCTQHDN